MNLLRKLVLDEHAATMTDYAVLLAIVSLGLMSAVILLSDAVTAVITITTSHLGSVHD